MYCTRFTANIVNNVEFVYMEMFHDEILRDRKRRESLREDVAKILMIYSHDAIIKYDSSTQTIKT